MIPRYSRPEMTTLWTDAHKWTLFLEIELLAAEAMAEQNLIPKEAAQKLRQNAKFNPTDLPRMAEIEKQVKHDVIAFLTTVKENLGDESRFLHQGLTSSDVLDTVFALQLKQAADILAAALQNLMGALKKRATEHKDTLCIGRSHGMHAEPTTFGLKLAGHYAAFARHLERLQQARAHIAVCALSGAVGTYSSVPMAIESHVAQKLGLECEPVSTQVIPRDRHAFYFSVLAGIAASIENLAIEIRHLQRTELREAEEYFSAGQKGSSAMPHKRNPVLSENLTGLARVVRAAVIPALENVALWHERDISHSSVERMIAPDATVTLDFALHRMTNIIENLIVYPDRMRRNLESLGGLVFSQRMMLALTQKGISREDSYKIVQDQAMKVWDQGTDITQDFRSLMEQEESVQKLFDKTELDDIFDLAPFTANIDAVFKRLFG